tara:strand:- start:2307 stop:2726 length:420 start_codon:yes stop_codon:yes gene_type:complete
MVNSWSLLYDAMNDDDMLSFNVEGVDLPSEVYPPVTGNVDITVNSERFKYNEDAILKELKEYISATYNQHYSSEGIQTLDLIESCGDGEAFCRSNILKYASRYDKKGTARRDIMKILHYAVLLLNFNDKNAKRESYETF